MWHIEARESKKSKSLLLKIVLFMMVNQISQQMINKITAVALA